MFGTQVCPNNETTENFPTMGFHHQAAASPEHFIPEPAEPSETVVSTDPSLCEKDIFARKVRCAFLFLLGERGFWGGRDGKS